MVLSRWLNGLFCVAFVHAIHDADVLNLYKNTYTGDVSTYFKVRWGSYFLERKLVQWHKGNSGRIVVNGIV